METAPATEKPTAKHVLEAVRERFCSPSYALLTEVADATGMAAKRRIDAIAMSLYPSRGLDLHGIEIKVSASDLKRELDDPDKAEAIAKHCRYWWIAAPKGVAKPASLPTNWGLLEVSEGIATVKKQAIALQPSPPTWEFLAAVMRRATEQSVDAEMLKAERQRGWKEGHAEGKRSADNLANLHSSWREACEALRKQVKEFEQAAGVEIVAWRAGQIGEAVKTVLSAEKLRREAAAWAERAKEASERLAEVMATLANPR